MRIYFDTCSLNRPLDDKTQLRIALEAEAVLLVLSQCEAGAIQLVTSDVLTFECARNPHPTRRDFLSEILAKASVSISLTEAIAIRARTLEGRGFKALDALHLASAEAERVDYFCTCDDRFLRRARSQPDLAAPVVSPLQLAEEIL